MRATTKKVAAWAAAAAVAAVLVPSVASAGPRGQCDGSRKALAVTGLTGDGELVCFREDRPGRIVRVGAVTGLVTDSELVGIDYRPATGELVGLGDAAGVYVVDPTSGAATLLSRLNSGGMAPAPIALSGSSFDVDFNPTVDRLRVVSDAGQNLRVKIDDGVTATDGQLSNGAMPPVTSAVGAAYTNNDLDPSTATTLFDIDAGTDQVFIQIPPNSGTLNAAGKLGVDAGADVGFDIYSTVRQGRTVEVQGLTVLQVDGASRLYGISLLSGFASLQGTLPVTVVDLAIPLAQL